MNRFRCKNVRSPRTNPEITVVRNIAGSLILTLVGFFFLGGDGCRGVCLFLVGCFFAFTNLTESVRMIPERQQQLRLARVA